MPLLSVGGKGIISVASNIVPKPLASIYDHYLLGSLSQAREAHYYLLPLMKALFMETNPIPVKTALALMGKIRLEFRLPLCNMSEENLFKLQDVMGRYELI